MENKSERAGEEGLGWTLADWLSQAPPTASTLVCDSFRVRVARPRGQHSSVSCVFARPCANVSADVKHVRLCRRVLHFSATFLRLTGPRAFGATQEQTQETQLAAQLRHKPLHCRLRRQTQDRRTGYRKTHNTTLLTILSGIHIFFWLALKSFCEPDML